VRQTQIELKILLILEIQFQKFDENFRCIFNDLYVIVVSDTDLSTVVWLMKPVIDWR